MDTKKIAIKEGRRKSSIELSNLCAKVHRIADSRERQLIEDETTVHRLLVIKVS